MPSDLIEAASIEWRGAQPFATNFEDIFFSEDGPLEVERVFLQPCGLMDSLPERLTVAEFGFGTGLNYAVLADRVLAQTTCNLHFISFEAYPLNCADWQKVHATRPQYSIYKDFANHPLPLLKGWQRRTYANGRITLSIFHGDVVAGMESLKSSLTCGIDAWFLDGFAPDKNPAMWSDELFQSMAGLSKQGARAATFTAAGRVRRGLQSAGFTVEKIDQRPFKRESLLGRYAGPVSGQWSTPPATVTVHGAGIGGCMVARHLADQHINVKLHDPNGIAAGASHMTEVMLHARLLGDGSVSADLRAQSFHYATQFLDQVLDAPPSGTLQLESMNLDAKKIERISQRYAAKDTLLQNWIVLLDAQQSSDLSQQTIISNSLFYPNARRLNLSSLCGSLCEHSNIQFSQTTAELSPDELHIICCGSATRDFQGLDWLEISNVSGQLDHVSFTPSASQVAIIGDGYFIPTIGGAVIGSTYERDPWATAKATAHNVAKNREYLPAEFEHLLAQRGNRCVSSDRLPLVGKVRENVWLATAFGSMGTTFAPYAAAHIAADLIGWHAPGSLDIAKAINPMRIAERQARRGVRHR